MVKKRPALFMVTGLLMLVFAAALLVYNVWDENRAGRAAEQDLPKVQQLIAQQDTPEPTALIDGYAYIGVLYIPAIEIRLPVLQEWSYPALRIAPCRYTGSVEDGSMVVAAHNYNRHFGKLNQLKSGDIVLFTDMSGEVHEYKVAQIELIPGTNVEEMLASEYPLTLFTCSYYNNRNRVTVRCELNE